MVFFIYPFVFIKKQNGNRTKEEEGDTIENGETFD
jgi:hypothetical protein